MTIVRTIAKNMLVLLIASIVGYILQFFFIMYTARHLGAEGFGILMFALAFTGIFHVFADLGLGVLTVREVARDKKLAGKYLGNITTIKMILIIVTFGLITITINLLGYPEQTIKVVYLITFSVIFNSFTLMFYSIFQAFEKMEYLSVGHILNGGLLLFGALFAISQEFNVIGFALIYFFGSLIVLSYSFVICIWKFTRPKIEIDWKFWKPTIKKALPFGLSGIFITIYFWVDSVMLSFIHGNTVVGWYNAALKLIGVLLFIPSVISIAIFPGMSRFYISSKSSLNLMYRKFFKFMLIIGIPLGVGTTLLADRVIFLIFGVEYVQSVIALRILIWATVFIFANVAFTQLFVSINKQIIVTKITGICMIENIVLNLLIIPRFSYIGASITTVITEFTIVILLLIFAYKTGYGVHREEFFINLFKPTIAALIMGVFIWELRSLNLLILVLLSITLYIVILYIIGGINKEDIELLKQVRRSKSF